MCPTSTLGLVHLQSFEKHIILISKVNRQYTDGLVPKLDFITLIVALVVINLGTNNN